jgi:hypothetical protein
MAKDTHTADAAAEPTYTVEDRTMLVLAVGDPTVRRHEIMAGDRLATHAFTRAERTAMPQSHALKFLGIADMEVRDDKGAVIGLKQADGGDGKPGMVLSPGRVVADLTELTREALVNRAEVKPGYDGLGRSPSKGELIAFLTALIVGAEPGTEPLELEEENPD